MLIAPMMGVGVSSYFPYLHRNCIALASGGIGDAFMDDNDRFALDEVRSGVAKASNLCRRAMPENLEHEPSRARSRLLLARQH